MCIEWEDILYEISSFVKRRMLVEFALSFTEKPVNWFLTMASVQPQEYRNDYFPVYDANTLSYQQFVQQHLLKHKPCIIKNTVHSNQSNANWPIYDKWLNNDKSALNFDYLSKKYGNVQVKVAQCGESYGPENRKTISFGNYLKILREQNNANNQNLQKWLNNVHQNKLSHFDPRWTEHILYLDGTSDIAKNENLYQTPKYFVDDWLNYFCDQTAAENDGIDFSFCYLGPQFSWTQLHFDVLGANSWSTNVLGQKLWIVFNPEESEKYLYHADKSKNESIGHLLALSGLSADELAKHGYAHLNELFDADNALLSQHMVIQKEYETIFIPSMWHHEVYNLDECVLSINHNWFNGFNIDWVWKLLRTEYEKVRQSPMICKMKMMKIFSEDEMYDDMEKLVRDECGNNFEKFIKILSVNTRNILDKLSEYEQIVEFVEEDVDDAIANEYEFEMKCNVFSLKKVVELLLECIECGCMNQRHVKQMRVIQHRIETALNGLKFAHIKKENWL